METIPPAARPPYPSRAGTTIPPAIYPILTIGVLSFAFSAILVRFAEEGPPIAIAVWRTVFTVVMLIPFAARRIGPEIRRYPRKHLWLIAAAGVLLGLHFVTWIASLSYTTVASSSVLVTTSPIFLALLGFFALRERLRPLQVIAVILGVTGAAIIAIGDASESQATNPLLGNGLALTAALFVSLYLLIGRVVRKDASWIGYVFPLYFVVALTTVVVAVATGTRMLGYSLSFYGICALMALGPQLIGHGALNYAIRYVPAAMLGLLTLLEPVGASILAFLLFDEAPGGIAVTGMIVVLSALLFATDLRSIWRRTRRNVPGYVGPAKAPGGRS